MPISGDISFLFEIGSLRKVMRTWSEFLGNDVANVSEHTFRVAWISLILAKYEGLVDESHLLKLALVHDISEIRCVDVHYLSRQYVERNEEKAVKDTFSSTLIGGEFVKLWKEMEKKETLESQIVKDADILDANFELVEKFYEGYKVAGDWKEDYLIVGEKKLYTETAKKMQREIWKSNPHDWHLLSGSNRFQGGDYKII